MIRVTIEYGGRYEYDRECDTLEEVNAFVHKHLPHQNLRIEEFTEFLYGTIEEGCEHRYTEEGDRYSVHVEHESR